MVVAMRGLAMVAMVDRVEVQQTNQTLADLEHLAKVMTVVAQAIHQVLMERAGVVEKVLLEAMDQVVQAALVVTGSHLQSRDRQ